MFPVGAFARLGGVSIKMLRAYDHLGLFRPVWVDPGSGYRYYSPVQLPELRRILALRDMGMGLDEIRRLVTGRADLGEALERRRRQLQHDRREMERRLAALDIRVEMAAGGRSPLDVVVRSVPEEPVATLDLQLVPGGDPGRGFYELEAHVRDLGRRASRPPGALVEEDAGSAGRGRLEIFVPLSRAIHSTERIESRRLPAARLATAIHRGPYESAPEATRGLRRWIGTAGLTPAGPLRILYLQFGAEPELRVPRGYVVEDAADFVTEIQIPVSDV